MKSLEELREMANKASVNLLFADAEVAGSMIDLACLSRIPDLKERRINQALKAYSFIRQHIPTVSLTPDEALALDKKLALIELRLNLRS